MEISNLHETDFRVMIVRMIQDLRKKTKQNKTGNHLSVHQWMNKQWSCPEREYYLAMKKEDALGVTERKPCEASVTLAQVSEGSRCKGCALSTLTV